VTGKALRLNEADRKAGSLPSAIKAAAERQSISLHDGWKASVALHLVSEWAESRTCLPDPVLDQFDILFKATASRFDAGVAAVTKRAAE
jgi:hypothetical protein